jgi:hypothetical protein
MTINSRFKDAITGSIELEKRGEHGAALGLLDEVIAEAIRKGAIARIRTLCHHAAIISRFKENWAPAKRYYEQSLASEPENARALCGLAAIALDAGDAITALKYATRCHTSMLQSDEGILRQGLLDLITKNWPVL